MKNQVSYVRKHFIDFAVQCVPMITEMLPEEEAVVPVERLVICLIETLRSVDLSLYGEDSDGTNKRNHSDKEHAIRATLIIKKQAQRLSHIEKSSNLVINSELDIATIIESIKSIIYHCLVIEPNPSDLTFTEEYEYIEGSGFSFKSFFGTGDSHDKLVDRHTKLTPLKEAVLACLKPLFISSIYCWTDLCIFLPRDYLFSRTGVIGFRHEDQALINAMIENAFKQPTAKEEQEENFEDEKASGKKKKRKARKKKKPLEPTPESIQDVVGTLDSYIKNYSNNTQNMLIDVLKPIAFHYPNHLIQEALTIWLK